MRNESGITEHQEVKLEISKDLTLELLNSLQNHTKRCANLGLSIAEYHQLTQASIAYFLQHYLETPTGENVYAGKAFLLKYLDRALEDKNKTQ
jgi:hypothetical protein